MVKIKETYVSPTTEALELRCEGVVCGSIQANGTESGNVKDPSDFGFSSWD